MSRIEVWRRRVDKQASDVLRVWFSSNTINQTYKNIRLLMAVFPKFVKLSKNATIFVLKLLELYFLYLVLAVVCRAYAALTARLDRDRHQYVGVVGIAR